MRVLSAERTIEEVEQALMNWAKASFWHAKSLEKLKPRHLEYMRTLLQGMRELNESEMNNAWARVPSSLRQMDNGERIVAELLCSFSTVVHANKTKVF